MIKQTYSVQELELHLDEALDRVRSGEAVVVTDQGRRVAEIRPLPAEPSSLEEGLRELQEMGVIGALVKPEGTIEPLARRPGALARFLESR
jgi:antitoxin (DNA-binding transcriptional repressor) of toxin-antitoxin stability system